VGRRRGVEPLKAGPHLFRFVLRMRWSSGADSEAGWVPPSLLVPSIASIPGAGLQVTSPCLAVHESESTACRACLGRKEAKPSKHSGG
jgi:hypothetical protein